jgi:peptidyl-prolyl cis-trans isomerase SurA
MLRTPCLALTVAVIAVPGLGAQTPQTPPSAPQSRGVIIERVLVRVNGEILTQTQLTQRQVEELRTRGLVPDPKALQDEALRAKLAEITPDVLKEVVDELLIVQHGRELGVKFTDADFARALDSIKTRHSLDDAKLKEALAAEGLSLERLRQDFERNQIIMTVQSREIGSKITPTLEEMRQYYAANRSLFMTPTTVTIREIFFAVPAGSGGAAVPGGEAAARARVEAALARIRGGEDFAAVAKEVSESANKASGGLIGPIVLEEIDPALRQVLEKLKPGELAPLITSTRGFQIIRLEERAEPALQPFDAVRTRVESAIREIRILDEQERLLYRLRAQAVIEWKDPELQRMYETRVPSAKPE